jgi:hypothetical protein
MTTRHAQYLFVLGVLLAIGCDSNPEGPHVPVQARADAQKAAPNDPPLAKKGGDNPRGVQYAKPD